MFFGQSGPFSVPALRGLVRAKSVRFDIVAVVQGVRRPVAGETHSWSKPSRFRPRRILGGQNLCDVAVAAGIPTLRTMDVNADVVVAELEALKPDLLVCVGFHCLFGAKILALPRLFGVNVHPSMLPRWRGPSPIFWTLKECEPTLGVSIHVLSPGEDTGDIFWQTEVKRPRQASGGELYRVAAEVAVMPLLEILSSPETLERHPQAQTEGPRARRPSPEDLEVVPAQWGCEDLGDFMTGASYFHAVTLVIDGDRYRVKGLDRFELGEDLPGDWLEADGLFGARCRDGTIWVSLFDG